MVIGQDDLLKFKLSIKTGKKTDSRHFKHSHPHVNHPPKKTMLSLKKMSVQDTCLNFKHFTWKGTNYDFLENKF